MIRKIILAAIVLCILLIASLQFFLAYGLTDSLRKLVIPTAKAKYNADISVSRVSVNLLGGSLSIRDIKVANPPGFEEPLLLAAETCRLKVGLPALLKSHSADIRHATLKNVILTVSRNRQGYLNIEPLLNTLQLQKAIAPERRMPAGGRTGARAREEIPNFIIKKMETAVIIDYLDWQIGEPFKVSLELNALLNNIANFGLNDSLSGTFNIQGNILGNDRKCAFDLSGRIAPLTDPLQTSFEATGSMQTIDLKTFKEPIGKIGLEDGKASGTIILSCRKGKFDPEKSVLRLKLSELVPTKEKAEKMGDIPMPPFLNLEIPISGSIVDPKIDIPAAFLKSMTSDDTVNAILQNIIDKKAKNKSEVSAENSTPSGAKSKKIDANGLWDEIIGGAKK